MTAPDVAAALAGIAAQIDAGPWPLMLVWADALEDAGESDAAAGMRWLARLEKFPAHDRGLYFWMPPRSTPIGTAHVAVIDPTVPGSACARLPYEALHLIRESWRLTVGRSPGEFGSLSAAFLTAARAVGTLLRDGRIRP